MDRLAELRESQALTLRDLAERSGVDANTINQVELGHRKPRPSTLRKLAKALDVEVEDFFRDPAPAGEAEEPPPKAAVLRETELRAETDEIVDLGTEDFADLLATLADRGLIDLQEQLMLLLRYRYAPKVVETWEEARAYMQSAEKKRGDRAGELLRMAIKAMEARANERIEARTKALEPA